MQLVMIWLEEFKILLILRSSLVVQWLRLCASSIGSVGLIPGQGVPKKKKEEFILSFSKPIPIS